MSEVSTIEWTDATWNPVRGCTKISPAASTAMPRPSPSGSEGCLATPTSRASTCGLVPEKLAEPLKWATPKMVFVNSMSDLFHGM